MQKTFRKDRAVALKYEARQDNAPEVIAKGEGRVAEKIIAVARENGIYVHPDPNLVEVLSRLDLNEEIPEDLYIVIAELLAFVYSLNREKNTS